MPIVENLYITFYPTNGPRQATVRAFLPKAMELAEPGLATGKFQPVATASQIEEQSTVALFEGDILLCRPVLI